LFDVSVLISQADLWNACGEKSEEMLSKNVEDLKENETIQE